MERKSSSRVYNEKLMSFKRKSRKWINRENVSKGVIRRLARRGGVKRISALIYSEVRDILKLYLTKLIRDSIIFCDYSKRKTVLAEDVVRAIKNHGQILYGFDERPFPFSKKSSAKLVENTQSTSQNSYYERSTRASSSRFRNGTESISRETVSAARSNSVARIRRSNRQSPGNKESLDSTLENLPVFRLRSPRRNNPGTYNEGVVNSDDDST